MVKLWNEGVRMWDQYLQEYFTLKAIIFVSIHDAPGALQYLGKLKERVDAMFAWMELHQFTFHHPENWCSCDTDGSWRENISTTRRKDILTTRSRKIVPQNGILKNFYLKW
jgi:hypothetical protein